MSSALAPMLLGTMLLGAALLKGYDVASTDLSVKGSFTSRWFLTTVVVFEIGLGLWLFSGLHSQGTRWLALATFLVFFEIALHLAITGETSCRCLGRLSPSPWVAVLFDSLAVVVLLFWCPRRTLTVLSHPRQAASVLIAFIVAIVPALISMIDYSPQGAAVMLRADPRLASKAPIHLKKATTSQVLDKIEDATGLTLRVDARLAEPPAGLGEIQTKQGRAWALMEFIAQRQPVPVRWQPTDGGYRLVGAAPLGRTTPWIFSGIVLFLAAIMLTRNRLAERPQPPSHREQVAILMKRGVYA